MNKPLIAVIFLFIWICLTLYSFSVMNTEIDNMKGNMNKINKLEKETKR